MALTTLQKRIVAKVYMSVLSSFNDPINVLKPDVFQAVTDADEWTDSNDANFKTALNVNFRSGMTNTQIALLHISVVIAKYLLDPSALDALSKLVEEMIEVKG